MVFTVLIIVVAVLRTMSASGVGDLDDAADGLDGSEGFLASLLSPIGLAELLLNVTLTFVALLGWATSALASAYLLEG